VSGGFGNAHVDGGNGGFMNDNDFGDGFFSRTSLMSFDNFSGGLSVMTDQCRRWGRTIAWASELEGIGNDTMAAGAVLAVAGVVAIAATGGTGTPVAGTAATVGVVAAGAGAATYLAARAIGNRAKRNFEDYGCL
jgi:hypothetical protein